MNYKRTALNIESKFKTRAEGEDLYLDAYFAVFDSPYVMWEGVIEQIARHAFDKTINGDVRALINHDSTLVLGRNTSGTLKLKTDDHGLWGEILINRNDQDAVNLYERVKRGDVSQCSFGFDILAEEVEHRDDGVVVWTITDLVLYEVSVVTFPAYEATSVQARKNDLKSIKDKRNKQWREKALSRLKGEKNGT